MPPVQPPSFASKVPSVSTFSPEYKKIEEEAGLWNQEIVENAYKLGGHNFDAMIERYRSLIRKVDGELDNEAEKFKNTQDELVEAKEDAKRKIEARKREKEAAMERQRIREEKEKQQRLVEEREKARQKRIKDRLEAERVMKENQDKVDAAKAEIASKAKHDIALQKTKLEAMKRRMEEEEKARMSKNATAFEEIEKIKREHQERMTHEESRLNSHEFVNQKLGQFLAADSFADWKTTRVIPDDFQLGPDWALTDNNELKSMQAAGDKNFEWWAKVDGLKKREAELETQLKHSKRLMKMLVSATTYDLHASPLISA